MALYKQGIFILRNIVSRTSITPRTEVRNINRWVAPTLRELKKRKDRLGPQPEAPRSSYLDWNYQAEIYAFGKRLNEEFNKNMLEKALTNRSFIIQEELRQQEAGIENPNINIEDNANLIREGEEFLIDCTKRQLKIALPKFPLEGIEAVCEKLTSNEFLANIALNIGLKDLILCAEYPPETLTLCNTFKAIIAALLHSSGVEKTSTFIEDFVILRQLVGRDINEMFKIENPQKMLTELLKAEPEARLCNHSAGCTILAAYQVGLYLDKRCVGLGWGESIDIATEMAARDGLKRIFGTTDSMPAIRVKQLDTEKLLKLRAQVH